jgi:outer membrane protein TolC
MTFSRAIPLAVIFFSYAPQARAAAAGPAGTVAVPDRPLSLAECTAIALKHNPQITSADQGVVSARAGLTRARSSYYPQLSFDAVEGFVGSDSPASPDGGTDRREDASIVLGQTLWQRGRRESIAQSKASLRAAEFDRTSTVQSLIEQVASDYYAVLAASQLVGVAEAGVSSAQSHLDQVRARIKLGDAAEVEVYPAEDDLARAQLDLIDARSNVRLALASLRNTLGISPGTEVQLAEAAPPEQAELPLLPQGLDTALARRPEVLAGQAAIDASRNSLKLAKIRRGPVADVSGQYLHDYSEWALQERGWDVQLRASLPVFDGYATKADETAARASLARTEADYQRTINQVGLEVESALVEAERARERVTASAASVAAAEARLAAAEGKYRQGIGILLEVIDARVAVTNARASQVRARYDHQTALVAVQRALGTLAVPEPATAEANR